MDIQDKQLIDTNWIVLQKINTGASRWGHQHYYRIIKTPYNPTHWGTSISRRGVKIIYSGEQHWSDKRNAHLTDAERAFNLLD